jgi:hypothetical protein
LISLSANGREAEGEVEREAEWEEEGELKAKAKAKVRRTAISSRVAREIRVICSEGVGCARSGVTREAPVLIG